MRLFIASAPGVEEHLLAEVEELGLGQGEATAGGVALEGDLEILYRANLELSLATQIRVRVASFPARQFSQLERKTKRAPLADWFIPGAPLRVRVSSKRSRLYHTSAIGERLRKFVGEVLGAECPAPAEAELAPTLHARLVSDECVLSVDTSGSPLYRRGYRRGTGKAPLRADLGRALLRLSGWDRETPLVDPMMGSGTLVIEAATWARHLAPGLPRLNEEGSPFAFCDAPGFDAALFDAVVAAARQRAAEALPFAIFGSDRDAGALRIAEQNAERAGVLSDLTLSEASFDAAPGLATPAPAGTLVANLPYGRRVGKGRDLGGLYKSFGRVACALPAQWRVAIVAADRRLALSTGLALETALLTDHGGQKVRFLVRGAAASAE